MRDHLVRLSDDWALWKWFALRGTGFPIDQVLRLADPKAAAAVDRHLRAESEATARCADALAHLKARREQGASHKEIGKAIRRLVAVQRPGAVEGVDRDVLQRAEQACALRDELRASAETAVAAARVRNAVELRAVAAGPRFREALLWQNRAAFKTGVDHLLRRAAGASDAKTRNNELMVWTYLQRYCAKNDTIGFFGPVGWGTFTEDDQPVAMQPGRSLLARRTVFFEHWSILALARKLAEDAELLRDVAPRMFPAARLDGTALNIRDHITEVTPVVARLLSACDGKTSARAIAAALVRDPDLGLSEVDEVYALLSTLADQRAILWALEIPTSNPYPERSLAERLRDLPESASRARAEAALDELTGARDAVARAAGDVEALDRAMGAFDATFTRLTGAPPTRNAGRVYGARTPLYEDTSRDLALTLGAPALAHLAPLRLVLHCARWLASAIAQRYLDLFESTYRRLRSALGTSTVEYQRFLVELEPHLPTTGRAVPPIVSAVVTDLRDRWLELIDLDATQRQIQLRAKDLEPAIHAWQPASVLWPNALFHSPDLMIAARDLDAIDRGELLVVLGELHITINSVIGFGLFFPEPATMAARFLADLNQTFLEEVFPIDGTIRGDARRLIVPGSLSVESDEARSRLPRDCVLPISRLELCEREGRVVVSAASRDSTRRSLELLSIFAWKLTWATLANFSLFPEQAHVPRVAIDRLVLHRESWIFAPGDLPFAAAHSAFDRFSGARRWMHSAGLPRWVFVKIPEELKPYYIDFESPISIELLAKLVRKASRVRVSEMLPTPDQAWLTDAEGQRYLCELRASALDLRPPAVIR
jgi:lantibiotic biosynthesis dehydratase-like protein